MSSVCVHASCVAFGTKAVLIRGKSGSGKSDLVLQLIDAQGFGLGAKLLRAKLVADDQVFLLREDDKVFASPPEILAGKLEVRGRGIFVVPFRKKVKLACVIDLMPQSEINRMPEPAQMMTDILGLQFPTYCVDPTKPSAASRIRSFQGEMRFT